jgi:CBS domain-containing protein
MNEPCVRDAMRKGIVSCPPSMSAREAAKLMAAAKVRALVVMEGNCGLMGIVSQTDLVNATLERAQGWDAMSVKDVMTPNVLTVSPQTPLSQAAKLLIDQHVHRLVVVDENTPCNPIGILSMGDIVRTLAKE